MEDYSKNDLVAHLKEALKQLRENEKKNAELVESRDTLLAKTQGLLAKFKQSQQRVQELEEEDRTKSEQSGTMVAKMKSLFKKLQQTDKARADAVQAASQAEEKERALVRTAADNRSSAQRLAGTAQIRPRGARRHALRARRVSCRRSSRRVGGGRIGAVRLDRRPLGAFGCRGGA